MDLLEQPRGASPRAPGPELYRVQVHIPCGVADNVRNESDAHARTPGTEMEAFARGVAAGTRTT